MERFHVTVPLDEFMESISYEEYLIRLQWIEDEFDRPNRSDHYLMLIAAEVRRVLSKNPNLIKLNDFKLNFKDPPELTLEEATRISKARVAARSRRPKPPVPPRKAPDARNRTRQTGSKNRRR